MPRRIFDCWDMSSTEATLSTAAFIPPLKPVLCTNPDLAGMFDLVEFLLQEGNTYSFYLIDPYMQLLDSGISGEILRPKKASIFELSNDYDKMMSHIHDDLEHQQFGKSYSSKLIFSPILPVNLMSYNKRQHPNSEDRAEQTTINEVIDEVNNSIYLQNSQRKLETPFYNIKLNCTDIPIIEENSNGLTLTLQAVQAIQSCVTKHHQRMNSGEDIGESWSC